MRLRVHYEGIFLIFWAETCHMNDWDKNSESQGRYCTGIPRHIHTDRAAVHVLTERSLQTADICQILFTHTAPCQSQKNLL
ncbi:hypothetical protein T07_4324 [Trichinella nelsoni]|uniref:Uncharacterized protein n=1 Tax=Trichinella nelsoni TaxID=6336 RepID=A0A0V0RBD3_9BILA|nr:hypothetical protein T07_4324 [Trichinella nelsoni]